MITVNIQKVARRAKVLTAYQFQKLSGFSPAMSARIYKGQWKRIDVSTMNVICNVLNCTPNDILNFKPDPEE